MSESLRKNAFNYLDLNWEDYVITDKRYERPNEVHHLLGDPSKAKKLLNWEPKVSFEELVKNMVDSDLLQLKRKSSPRQRINQSDMGISAVVFSKII